MPKILASHYVDTTIAVSLTTHEHTPKSRMKE